MQSKPRDPKRWDWGIRKYGRVEPAFDLKLSYLSLADELLQVKRTFIPSLDAHSHKRRNKIWTELARDGLLEELPRVGYLGRQLRQFSITSRGRLLAESFKKRVLASV